MSGSHVVSIDQGTTSTRVLVVSPDGDVVGTAQREHVQHHPAPGWVEHDAAEIWQTTRELLGLALTRAGIAASDVAAVGISNQRETTVLWDAETGRPVHRAIVWQDTRTEPLVHGLVEAGHGARITELTGLRPASYFSAPRIRWVLDEVPEARDLAQAGRLRAGTIDTWLVWNLTGGARGGAFVTDVTNASRTLLMDLDTLSWSPELGEMLGLDAALLDTLLPTILPSSGEFGVVAEPSPLAGVPVTGVLGDQQAASFGQHCLADGDVKNTYGTGCFLLQNTGTERRSSAHGLVTTVAYQLAGQPAHYALEGSVAVAGALVQWLRDGLGIIRTSAEVQELAATVPDDGGVVIVPAFSGLYAPHWRPDARGIIAGLTAYATRAHIARAAVEATAYQSRDVLAAVVEDTGRAPALLRVDGGMTVNDDLMQFQADILDVPVVRPAQTETTAMGAAYAAGLAAGVWSGQEELGALWREDRRWEPAMPASRRTALLERWDDAVRRSLGQA